MVVDGFVWIEAEDFADYGDWRLDTQFVQQMGSAYLIAAGVGRPIADATTELQLPQAGRYRLWVRAKNWIREHAPGKFAVSVERRPRGTCPRRGGQRSVGLGSRRASSTCRPAR